MPLPKPREGEKEEDFISRCVSFVFEDDPEMDKESDADRKQAVAMCYTQWREGKAIDYDEESEKLRQAWYASFPHISQPATPSDSWVVHTRSDSVIVEIAGRLYEVSFSEDENGDIVFADRSEWVEVERITTFEQVKGNALKTISRDDETIRVANRIVLFGGRDLEGVASPNVNADGSLGEFFSKATDLSSAYTATGTLYMDWEHGMGLEGEPGEDDVLGVVDWKTAQVDDKGVFVERVLNRRNQYVAWMDELGWFDDGVLGTSSEAISGEVKKADNGELLRWPLRRDTLTVTPMEPRMLTQNQITALKGLAEVVPAVKALIPAEPTQEPTDDNGGAGALRRRGLAVRARLHELNAQRKLEEVNK